MHLRGHTLLLHELQVNRRMHRPTAFLATHRAAAQAAAAAQATTEDAEGARSAESAGSGLPAWRPRNVLDTTPSVSDGVNTECGRGYRRRGVVCGQRRCHAGTHAFRRYAAKVSGDLLK